MAEIRTPKSIGKRIGRVLEMDATSFTLVGETTLRNGDGLCFFDPSGTLVGLRVNRVQGNRIFPKDSPLGLRVGTELYRNNDLAFHAQLEQSRLCRTIGLRLTLTETGDGLQLAVVDEDGLRSATTLAVAREKARTPGAIETVAAKQLQKSGGTVLSVDEIRLQIAPDLFVPAAALNELRRQALNNHLETRRRSYARERVALVANSVPWPRTWVDYRDNIYNSRAAAFYRRHGVERIDPERLRADQVADCALMTSKYCIRRQLGLCSRSAGAPDGSAEPLILADRTGRYLVQFD
jgi:putative protease